MEDLLFLVHRIPYPPNKGDKIRSYHLLKYLANHYRVHLGTFIDDTNDWQHTDKVKAFCGETCFASLHPVSAKIRSIGALAGSRPLSLDYYRNPALKEWVRQIRQRYAIKHVVVFSSVMAQYAADFREAVRIIDFVDIDSDKWRQYSEKKHWPLSWLYRREARQLLAYERKIANDCDYSLFVSAAEAALFKQLAPETAHKTGFFNNGVDTDYFSPHRNYANPYQAGDAAIVFTGAMDYWPNVDAVQWFATEIFPSVLAKYPNARFYIVGSRPSSQVQALGTTPGVFVTGTVPDVRPYLAHAAVCVAPLRIARGIQNKVLEAMSMAKCTIVSRPALEGIDGRPGHDLLLADNAEQFIDVVISRLQSNGNAIGLAARAKVEMDYTWASNLARIATLLETGGHEPEQISPPLHHYPAAARI